MKLFTITALMAGSGTVLAGLGDMQIDFPFVPVPVVFPRASTQNLQVRFPILVFSFQTPRDGWEDWLRCEW
jgi:hypothetical protein